MQKPGFLTTRLILFYGELIENLTKDNEGKTLFFLKKTYEYGDVHVMQDAQDDRIQICLNYVTKGPNVFANISR